MGMGKMRGKGRGTTRILPTCSVVDDAVAPLWEDNERCVDVFEISDRFQQNLAAM